MGAAVVGVAMHTNPQCLCRLRASYASEVATGLDALVAKKTAVFDRYEHYNLH